MLLDSQNLFSDNQQITIGTTDSTNTVRFGKGNISYLPLLIQVVSDFTNIDSLCVKILTSASEDFKTSVELAQCTLALEDLKAGRKFPIERMPKGNLGYIKLSYTAQGTSAETTGKITAGTVCDVDVEYEDDFYGAQDSSIVVTPSPSENPDDPNPTTTPAPSSTPEPDGGDDDDLPDIGRGDEDESGGDSGSGSGSGSGGTTEIPGGTSDSSGTLVP